MSDFNKGIEYAFDYIEKHMYGHNINGVLQAAILRNELKELRNKIPKKCYFCPEPCDNNWCSTKEEK